MKKIKVLALCAIVAGFSTSCEKSDVASEAQPEAVTETVSKKHLDGLAEAGVNPAGAFYESIQHPGQEPVDYLTSGDISIALENIAAQALAQDAENNAKQYRTNNLVSRNRTINVIGYTGGRFALTSRMRTGLQWAVNNYNALNNFSLNFNLTFATSTNGDMVVYNAGGTGQGGQAEFPNGGNPGKFIQILGGMANASNNVNEHVIGHEMGHALGFRHTDYAQRRCGGANEGQAGVGAINIPGTPTANRWGQNGLDSDSIMISCFDGTEDGEFSNFDIVALQFLY
ncbi:MULTISPECIES: M57 family metalloprotease [Aquimarina]|uniref:M57 family metalloprotease n=1 Tax=Aquimarina TaxID=290174 RepID=UPI000D6940F4|nr:MULTISPECIES: M57 family metalloprotease [Aquimarina]